MPTGAVTSQIDVAQLTLYAFWIFFAGLIFYLRREDKREGFPLLDDRGDLHRGFPAMPSPKMFLLPHGGVSYAPRDEMVRPLVGARVTDGITGTAVALTGNPLIDGIGPAAYAIRPDEPELTYDSGVPMIVPLRVAREYSILDEDPDPRGMEVIGSDGMTAGTIVDVWLDRSETIFRYLEMKLAAADRTVLIPLSFAQFLARRRLRVGALRADQFADVPALRSPESITLSEEDRICGYFGGGRFYATPNGMGPWL